MGEGSRNRNRKVKASRLTRQCSSWKTAIPETLAVSEGWWMKPRPPRFCVSKSIGRCVGLRGRGKGRDRENDMEKR